MKLSVTGKAWTPGGVAEIPQGPRHVRVLRSRLQVEKHWTEKGLSEMTERDWRIFREDFSIGYRGVNTVLPIRKWEESGLPSTLLKVRSKRDPKHRSGYTGQGQLRHKRGRDDDPK